MRGLDPPLLAPTRCPPPTSAAPVSQVGVPGALPHLGTCKQGLVAPDRLPQCLQRIPWTCRSTGAPSWEAQPHLMPTHRPRPCPLHSPRGTTTFPSPTPVFSTRHVCLLHHAGLLIVPTGVLAARGSVCSTESASAPTPPFRFLTPSGVSLPAGAMV